MDDGKKRHSEHALKHDFYQENHNILKYPGTSFLSRVFHHNATYLSVSPHKHCFAVLFYGNEDQIEVTG